LSNSLGITQEGLKIALKIKNDYKNSQPLVLSDNNTQLLTPESLMNHNIDLDGYEDPLALAMVASRDPEPPMALAAATRLCPLGSNTRLVSGLTQLVSEDSRYELVRECLSFVKDKDFDPGSIAEVRRHATKFIVRTRHQYTMALRQNLQCLLDGAIAPRVFVKEFFELTEDGNLRSDIRKKLILSLLLSSTVRPSVKFLMLENFTRMPKPIRMAIISGVLKAEPTRHTEVIKEELKYIVSQERIARGVHG